ncbi:hypothetical protein BDV93DRAFT_529365 [Ceratobasidium sp. AG-I]|nr:hypothetical protein BDV93DRAFT_529365 [Ceratobasidium sp. AG-I]
MVAARTRRVILVFVYTGWQGNLDPEYFSEAGCLVHRCKLPAVPSSFLGRMLKRNSPAPAVKAAYEFVVGNYRTGDDVVIFDASTGLRKIHALIAQNIRHTVIRQLAEALNAGSLDKSGSGSAGGRVPIKARCVLLQFNVGGPLRWSGVEQALSGLPSTVETFLCSGRSVTGDYNAYAIQRDSCGRIKRKECCYSSGNNLPWFGWLMFQTRHIIGYNPSHSWRIPFDHLELLSAKNYFNYTSRRGGLPCDDAILTGGQVIRVKKVWESHKSPEAGFLVWSAESFVEGKVHDVSRRSLC